ncbi:MAG: hypothetical protein AAGA23_21595 [Pseudomonadota bacterium]
MKWPRLRTIVLVPLVLLVAAYLVGAVLFSRQDLTLAPLTDTPAAHTTLAVLGASGTAGDGILEAALADPAVETIHVITRRTTVRMQAGEAAGKVKIWTHLDYLDYRPVHSALADSSTVYWALGTSSWGMDEETYGRIHVDFPVQFVKEWVSINAAPRLSFHYISSSDISADSSMMWAREKVRAEQSLFALADGERVKVIAYRPDYIGPTDAEAQLSQKLLYGLFAPVGAAVKATAIGESMLEVSARLPQFSNADKLNTLSILKYSDAYRLRQERP